jgi:hypothetical protein
MDDDDSKTRRRKPQEWAKEKVEVTKLKLTLVITILGLMGPVLAVGTKFIADWFSRAKPPELTIKSPEITNPKISRQESKVSLQGTCNGSDDCENVFVFIRTLPNGPWYVVSMHPVGSENKWYAMADLSHLAESDMIELMVRACKCSSSYLVDPTKDLPGLPDKGLKGDRTLWIERGK